MGGYGEAAVRAVGLVTSGKSDDPREAWETAVRRVFASSSSRNKGCPRCTFLGLCQGGMIKGIQPGSFTRSKKNRDYAVRAVQALKDEHELASNPLRLWYQVTEGELISYNEQMDVVIALWNEDLFR